MGQTSQARDNLRTRFRVIRQTLSVLAMVLLLSHMMRIGNWVDEPGIERVWAIVVLQVLLFLAFCFPNDFSQIWGVFTLILVAIAVTLCSGVVLAMFQASTLAESWWFFEDGLLLVGLIGCNSLCLALCPIGLSEKPSDMDKKNGGT